MCGRGGEGEAKSGGKRRERCFHRFDIRREQIVTNSHLDDLAVKRGILLPKCLSCAAVPAPFRVILRQHLRDEALHLPAHCGDVGLWNPFLLI